MPHRLLNGDVSRQLSSLSLITLNQPGIYHLHNVHVIPIIYSSFSVSYGCLISSIPITFHTYMYISPLFLSVHRFLRAVPLFSKVLSLRNRAIVQYLAPGPLLKLRQQFA